jgi:hypothetical protein
VSRRTILLTGLCAALGYSGVDWIRTNVEVATLHVSGGANHHYPRLFVVDDPPVVWIRAERPDRVWLETLRSNPEVVLHRRDGDVAYHARIWDHERSREHIDRLFRVKYGAFDLVSGWIWRRDAVPIQLESRDEFVSGS